VAEEVPVFRLIGHLSAPGEDMYSMIVSPERATTSPPRDLTEYAESRRK
jgi:hypothetical protein